MIIPNKIMNPRKEFNKNHLYLKTKIYFNRTSYKNPLSFQKLKTGNLKFKQTNRRIRKIKKIHLLLKIRTLYRKNLIIYTYLISLIILKNQSIYKVQLTIIVNLIKCRYLFTNRKLEIASLWIIRISFQKINLYSK